MQHTPKTPEEAHRLIAEHSGLRLEEVSIAHVRFMWAAAIELRAIREGRSLVCKDKVKCAAARERHKKRIMEYAWSVSCRSVEFVNDEGVHIPVTLTTRDDDEIVLP